MPFEYRVTLFTPTYNRAYILENLYRSLQKQTSFDFEWLVVDDGSTDGTEELFRKWIQEEARFPIRYVRQENGGKHRAWNKALERAKGELFFVVDSDDCLTQDAVQAILEQVDVLPRHGKYAGVCFCKGIDPQTSLGSSFDGEFLDCTTLERSKYGIEGDKAEVLFTDLAKQYPFPEIDGEKFMTEAVVWDRIAADGYQFRFINRIVYLAAYRADGLTMRGQALYDRNPKGYALYLKQSRRYRKFPPMVQRYFDVEFYRSHRKSMKMRQIAEELGVRPAKLKCDLLRYSIRQAASKMKRKILGNK